MNEISYQKSIPTRELYDVAVCGGGPAVIGAAAAADETGAKTAIIERFGFLGGMAAAGYVNPMSEFAYNGRRISGGIPWRFANEMVAMGGARIEEPRCNISFDPEVYKLTAYRMVSRAGADLYLKSVSKKCFCHARAVFRTLKKVRKTGLIEREREP